MSQSIINKHLDNMIYKVKKITNGKIVDGHPSIEGHEHIANLIYTKLNDNDCLSHKGNYNFNTINYCFHSGA